MFVSVVPCFIFVMASFNFCSNCQYESWSCFWLFPKGSVASSFLLHLYTRAQQWAIPCSPKWCIIRWTEYSLFLLAIEMLCFFSLYIAFFVTTCFVVLPSVAVKVCCAYHAVDADTVFEDRLLDSVEFWSDSNPYGPKRRGLIFYHFCTAGVPEIDVVKWKRFKMTWSPGARFGLKWPFCRVTVIIRFVPTPSCCWLPVTFSGARSMSGISIAVMS